MVETFFPSSAQDGPRVGFPSEWHRSQFVGWYLETWTFVVNGCQIVLFKVRKHPPIHHGFLAIPILGVVLVVAVLVVDGVAIGR